MYLITKMCLAGVYNIIKGEGATLSVPSDLYKASHAVDGDYNDERYALIPTNGYWTTTTGSEKLKAVISQINITQATEPSKSNQVKDNYGF